MSAEESSCALLQLPREVRDEIYSYCFHRTYNVFWSYCHNEYGEIHLLKHSFDNKPVIANLSILRTSTALSSDAKNFLFCRAASKATTFRYHIDFNYRQFSPPPIKEATDRMMNVEFVVEHSPPITTGFTEEGRFQAKIIYPDSLIEQIYGETLDHFTGTAIVRNSFRISISFCGPFYHVDFAYFVNTRFFQALKRLKGFQKSTISLMMASLVYNEDEDRRLREGFARVVADLKTHLGPCIEKKYKRPFIGLGRWSRLDLEFQPRKYYIESLRVETERAIKEVDRSGEEDTQET